MRCTRHLADSGWLLIECCEHSTLCATFEFGEKSTHLDGAHGGQAGLECLKVVHTDGGAPHRTHLQMHGYR